MDHAAYHKYLQDAKNAKTCGCGNKLLIALTSINTAYNINDLLIEKLNKSSVTECPYNSAFSIRTSGGLLRLGVIALLLVQLVVYFV
jgi:hypothetical protein